MGSPSEAWFAVLKATTKVQDSIFLCLVWLLKNVYDVNEQLVIKCKDSSDRNQFCNFVKFAQKGECSEMFLISAFIVGTIVYLHHTYMARLIVVYGFPKICSLVLMGQIIMVCSMLVSHQPMERFKQAFGVEHKNTKSKSIKVRRE